MKAAIFVNDLVDDDPDRPRSLLTAGGLTLIERQVRQLALVGVNEVRLISHRLPELWQQKSSTIGRGRVKIRVIDANFLDPADWAGFERLIVVEEGVLIDSRVLNAVASAKSANALALFPENSVTYGHGEGLSLSVKEGNRLFASCAGVTGDVMAKAAEQATFSSMPLRTVLEAALAEEGTQVIDIEAIDTYVAGLRRDLPILWRPLTTSSESGRATDILISRSQKGALDWPGEWIHPPFENALVRVLLRTWVSPILVSIITLLLGLLVAWAFATGRLGLGLAGAMVVGVLQGVDGKLARVKLKFTKFAPLVNVADRLVEYLWYAAIAFALSTIAFSNAPWGAGAMIIAFSLAGFLQRRFYRGLTGHDLADAGKNERLLHQLGASQNSIVWLLVPFALTQAWQAGFWIVALYALLSFFAGQWCLFRRIADFVGKSGTKHKADA